MPEFEVAEYSEYSSFSRAWQSNDLTADDETETRLLWQLLGQLDDEELLIQLPAWLAEEKVGFVDGQTPTTFVGRIDHDSKKAIRFADSAAAPQLVKLAHRIHNLEEGVEKATGDDARREWLGDRLQENRQAFERREDTPTLREEWLPKSQLELAVRRTNAD